MKTTPLILTLAVAILAAGISQGESTKTAAPKITIEEFRAKLKRDESPLPAGGQLQMTYAPVVDKVLPSVVTITSFGKLKIPQLGMGRGGDRIPPELREHFRRFFGVPFGEEGEEGFDPFEEQQPPRGRRQPREPQEEKEQRLGLGSGIIISADGYILTNNHVVEEGDKLEVSVTAADGSKKSYDAKVIGKDKLTDVALIKIDATGLAPATLADSGKLKVGDVVLAAGAPMDLERSVSMGIVSAMGRKNLGIVGQGRLMGFEDFIQTDAAINPGNSGGPLVDAVGRVVGVNTAIFTRGGIPGNIGIGFAIPVKMALHVVEDLLEDGKVQRGWLGIQMLDTGSPEGKEFIKAYNLPADTKGAIVQVVGDGSPAQAAGMEVGDVIVKVDGQPIREFTSVREIISSKKTGALVPVEVLRDGKPKALSVTLGTMPEEQLAKLQPGEPLPSGRSPSGAAPSKPAGPSTAEILKGLTVQDITNELREKYELAKDASGIVVTKVSPDSSAAAVGIQEGDVIQRIDRKPVANIGQAQTLAKGKQSVYITINRKGETILSIVRD